MPSHCDQLDKLFDSHFDSQDRFERFRKSSRNGNLSLSNILRREFLSNAQ